MMFRPVLRSGQLPLQAPHALPFSRCQSGGMQQFPGRQGSRDGYASIDTDHIAITRCENRLGYGGESNVPSSCTITGNSVGLHVRRYWSGPAEPHPAHFRNPDFPVFPAESADIPLAATLPYYTEPLVPASLAPRRPPGWVPRVEECSHGRGEVPQGLLLHRLGASSQPCMLSSCLGELSALLCVGRGALSPWMPVGVLLDGQVPHVSGVAAMLPHRRILGEGGDQTIPGHANTLSNTTDIYREVRRVFLWPDAGIFTPRF